ncbi:MAG: ATP-binding cassette domain-containing protein [Acholeplasmataceae bacterium]|jgi:ABC-2 type transport system ATP-binding protein
MLYMSISFAVAIVLTGIYFILMKKEKKLNKYLKIVSVILFVSAMMTLYYKYEIDKVNYKSNILFNPSKTIFMVVLRSWTPAITALAMFRPFYKNNRLKIINLFILPIITILNIIFYESNLVAMFGFSDSYFDNHRTYGFMLMMGILIFSSIVNVLEAFRKKDINFSAKEILMSLVAFLLISIAFIQQSGPQIIFNKVGAKADKFSAYHRGIIYFIVIFLIASYIIYRERSYEDKHLFLSILTYSALFQYFYMPRSGLNGLPFHLCNTAVVMMFLAHIFKLKGLFYFTYFVNVIGAAIAIIIPNISSDAISLTSIHFWFNHFYAFVIPILGVALHLFERPTLNMIYRAIGFFTLYFVFVAIINAWFNNYVETDYFFLYGDFIADKVPKIIGPVKYKFIFDINIGLLRFRFFYLYQLGVYVGFIILMFITWVIYDFLYRISDQHYELLLKKRKRKMDLLSIGEFLKEGYTLSDPLNEEAIGMIKFDKFTKRYAGSKVNAVEDFTLEVKSGEVFGFIGHNGAGKSTAIKSLVGIQSITSGSITVDGYDITKQPIEAKLRIGYVSDNHAVYEKLTGREYINYVADLYLVNQEDRNARIEKYTKMFNLTDAIDREIKGYSHGMKQKLVVIASLIHNPKVWVLDEPLTGLDPTSAFQIKEVMAEHARNGNIVFFSSHVIEVVEKICHKICIIGRGKLIGVYEIDKLQDQGLTLEKLYMQHVAISNINIEAPGATLELKDIKR